MDRSAKVSGNLFAPDRDDAMHAISIAMLKVRSNSGLSCDKLGKLLDCGRDAIGHATNATHMLSFDSIALLLYHFPDECAPIRALWEGASQAPSFTDRLDRIEREISALRRGA